MAVGPPGRPPDPGAVPARPIARRSRSRRVQGTRGRGTIDGARKHPSGDCPPRPVADWMAFLAGAAHGRFLREFTEGVWAREGVCGSLPSIPQSTSPRPRLKTRCGSAGPTRRHRAGPSFSGCSRTTPSPGFASESRQGYPGAPRGGPGPRPPEFDVILVEDLGRLTRTPGEALRLYQRLQFKGIEIVGVSDGIRTGRRGTGILVTIKGLATSSTSMTFGGEDPPGG